ncbi:MAG TPA: nuclear transport factor 2 family protein [Noviherbaspirillum sp.]|uniref:nuclear transport factor 2 family protein n=1 Tax=Noviherbaspirillum sp. TaxID=1926288 RepID=UPI002B46F3D3|nr:nuclear transport factor 2 family protein [Noviherbaspirillum sp.]HJV86255.1 nuclear transport factor 2 family protein [Noviherbaspirillum sp.]
MDIEQNKALVSRGYQLFQSGNIDDLLQLFADDIEWTGMEVENVPFSRDYHGRQDVGQFFAELNQAQEAQRFEPQDMIAEGDKVVVRGYAQWNVRSTGKTYSYPWVHCFTLRDGKVARFEQYFDTAATRDAFMPAGMGAMAGAAATTGAGTVPIQ